CAVSRSLTSISTSGSFGTRPLTNSKLPIGARKGAPLLCSSFQPGPSSKPSERRSAESCSNFSGDVWRTNVRLRIINSSLTQTTSNERNLIAQLAQEYNSVELLS